MTEHEITEAVKQIGARPNTFSEDAVNRLAAAAREAVELRKDKERLDWDYKRGNAHRIVYDPRDCWILDKNESFESRRKAIDAAMEKEKQ